MVGCSRTSVSHTVATVALSPISRTSSPAPTRSRNRANRRTVTRMRPSWPLGLRNGQRARRLVVGIGRRAFDPHIAALEVFMLPDGHDLLHAFDRISAGGEGFRSMR